LSDQIVADATNLPALSMVWHDSPYDEHPVADVSKGQDKIWVPSAVGRTGRAFGSGIGTIRER
jgi:hypothetical protein